jgi:hypothetical protein
LFLTWQKNRFFFLPRDCQQSAQTAVFVRFQKGFKTKDQEYLSTRGSGSCAQSGSCSLPGGSSFLQQHILQSATTPTAAIAFNPGTPVDMKTLSRQQWIDCNQKSRRERSLQGLSSTAASRFLDRCTVKLMKPYTPPRPRHKTSSCDSCNEYDLDHHTFATAMTALVTILFSTDRVNSVASEAGMEVVMSTKDSEMEDVSPVVHSKTHSFGAGKHTFTVDTQYSESDMSQNLSNLP